MTLLLALLLQDPAHGPKIADARVPNGPVTITRDQQALEVRRIAHRVVNGDVYDSDQVATGDAGSVDLIFADESRVTLEANTQVVVEQRHLRQAEGQRSIGRRIQILTGRVASDIVPNSQVGTEFVTPAGTAAVRGTLTDVGVANTTADAFFDMGDGLFLLAGGQGLFQMPAGTHAAFTVNPDGTISITNLDLRAQTGEPMTGQLGQTVVSIQPSGELTLRQTATGFLVVGATGAQINQNGTFVDPAPGSTLPFSAEPLFDTNDPLVPSSQGGANPGGTDGAFMDAVEEQLFQDAGAGAISTALATALGTSNIIDDFNRGDGTTIGNGWFENLAGPGADASIFAGMVRTTITPFAGSDQVHISRDTGNFSTFAIQSDFRFASAISGGSLEFALVVNGDGVTENGMKINYFPDSGVPSMSVFDGGVASNSIIPVNVGPDQWFTLRLEFDGSNLTGSLLQNGSTLSTVTAPGAVNFGDTDIILGAHNFDGINHDVDFDNLQHVP